MFTPDLILMAVGVLFLFFDVVDVVSRERVVNLDNNEVRTRTMTIWVSRTAAVIACIVGLVFMLAA